MCHWVEVELVSQAVIEFGLRIATLAPAEGEGSNCKGGKAVHRRPLRARGAKPLASSKTPPPKSANGAVAEKERDMGA